MHLIKFTKLFKSAHPSLLHNHTKAGFRTAAIFFPKYIQQLQVAYNFLTHV